MIRRAVLVTDCEATPAPDGEPFILMLVEQDSPVGKLTDVFRLTREQARRLSGELEVADRWQGQCVKRGDVEGGQ